MKFFLLAIFTTLSYLLVLLAGLVHQFPVTEQDEQLSQRMFKSGIMILFVCAAYLLYIIQDKDNREFFLETLYRYKSLIMIAQIFFVFPVLIMNI